MEEQFFTEEEYAKYLKRQQNLKRKYERILKQNFNPNGETLTSEEYLKLSQQIKKGDKQAENTLREKATYWAYDIVKDLYLDGKISGEFEDALQNTYLIMRKADINAFIKHNREKINKALSSYLKNSFDKIERRYKLCNMDLNGDRYQYEKVAKNIPVSAGYSKEFKKEAINEALSKLRPKEAYVLVNRYLNRVSLKEIGDHCGVSKESIRQIETNALYKLRQPNCNLYQYYIESDSDECQ